MESKPVLSTKLLTTASSSNHAFRIIRLGEKNSRNASLPHTYYCFDLKHKYSKMAQDGGTEDSVKSAPRNEFQQQDNPAIEKMKSEATSGNVSTVMIATRDEKSPTVAVTNNHTGKSRHTGAFFDERRDERGQKATPGSTGPKTQARAPPSPHGSIDGRRTPPNRLDFFDWQEEENNPATREPLEAKLPPGSSPARREVESERHANQVSIQPCL